MTPFEWISASIALLTLMLQFAQWKKDHSEKTERVNVSEQTGGKPDTETLEATTEE